MFDFRIVVFDSALAATWALTRCTHDQVSWVLKRRQYGAPRPRLGSQNNAELSSKSNSLLSVCGAGNFALAAGIGEWSLMRQERSLRPQQSGFLQQAIGS